MSDLEELLTVSLARCAMPGGLRFSERQLYFELGRRLEATWTRSAWLKRRLVQLTGQLTRRRHPLAPRRFTTLLDAYRATHGQPTGLLPTIAAPAMPLVWTGGRPTRAAAPPAGALAVDAEAALRPASTCLMTGDREPDLADYGLPRLLLCQSSPVAAMLRANRFHLELSCAVLAVDEALPLPEALRSMLARTPTAQVYLLHDASPSGLRLSTTLARALELPAGLRLAALGLRPNQVDRLGLLVEQGPLPTEPLPTWPGLDERESRWLAEGWSGSVEALAPARLLRSLRRAILARPTDSRGWLGRRPRRATGFMTWPEPGQSNGTP